jgi:hypothetical protein
MPGDTPVLAPRITSLTGIAGLLRRGRTGTGTRPVTTSRAIAYEVCGVRAGRA